MFLLPQKICNFIAPQQHSLPTQNVKLRKTKTEKKTICQRYKYTNCGEFTRRIKPIVKFRQRVFIQKKKKRARKVNMKK